VGARALVAQRLTTFAKSEEIIAMNLAVVSIDDVDESVRALVDAFAADTLIDFLFYSHPKGVATGAHSFFSILLRARIALRMPSILCRQGNRIAGVAMGYNTDPPEWPESFNEEWRALAAQTPGFAKRLAVYEAIATRCVPSEPHYYLGVIGVHPDFQGQGYGKKLLDEVCRLSASDEHSTGVYLETASPASLKFYYRNGFVLRGQGEIGGAPLWCVFRANGALTMG
jgi:GNAT superfamily N-acetyltransferase